VHWVRIVFGTLPGAQGTHATPLLEWVPVGHCRHCTAPLHPATPLHGALPRAHATHAAPEEDTRPAPQAAQRVLSAVNVHLSAAQALPGGVPPAPALVHWAALVVAQLPCWLHTPALSSTGGPAEKTQSLGRSGQAVSPIDGAAHVTPVLAAHEAPLGCVPGAQALQLPPVPAVPAAHGWHWSRPAQPRQVALTLSKPSLQPSAASASSSTSAASLGRSRAVGAIDHGPGAGQGNICADLCAAAAAPSAVISSATDLTSLLVEYEDQQKMAEQSA
jgi:hypothetical protein